MNFLRKYKKIIDPANSEANKKAMAEMPITDRVANMESMVVDMLENQAENTRFLKKKLWKFLKHFDKNKDGKLSPEERKAMLQSKEFWGLLIIFALPIISVLISLVSTFFKEGTWDWTILLFVIQVIEAPIATAYLRKTYNKGAREQETYIADIERDGILKDIAINLLQQYVSVNIPEEHQPPQKFMDKIDELIHPKKKE